ncbi:MAG: alpha-glucan family phosphorylase [candidate division Zixibacteria bacterium]|nr:alpha-glucan family phosphorylase [candidate division Zixibacteria bacterium]
MDRDQVVAYFSMEIGLESGMPTYSDVLGVLAGDTIRAAADLGVSMVAVPLLHRKGYFFQRFDESVWQHEEPVDWSLEAYLTEMPEHASVEIENRTVPIRAWKYEVKGCVGDKVPVYFLDTDLPENDPQDRSFTYHLYGGDLRYRLCQEVILGIGGLRMLRALGYERIERFHMNEGHASLLTLELLEESAAAARRIVITHEDVEQVRKQCQFTTHTPVPAGHDQFPMELVSRVLGNRVDVFAMDLYGVHSDTSGVAPSVGVSEPRFNMTALALNLSHYVNGVAKKHGEVSRLMFTGYRIDAITNGVHSGTWVFPAFRSLFDRYIEGWRQDNFNLRYALNIPPYEVWDTHLQAKRDLVDTVNHQYNAGLDVGVFTIGFARRAATYKRADLLFQDMDRLRRMAEEMGGIQLFYAGKAHPHDQEGKALIQRVIGARDRLALAVKLVYLPNYDIDLARKITAGVDIWLNTPEPPMEASGTSGMKAALNGVPSLSILDGWWIEGCIEGVTGWAIGGNGHKNEPSGDRSQDALSLYNQLEQVIMPQFYHDPKQFVNVMRHTIALNGSFFNTQRMMQQYVPNAYFK